MEEEVNTKIKHLQQRENSDLKRHSVFIADREIRPGGPHINLLCGPKDQNIKNQTRFLKKKR